MIRIRQIKIEVQKDSTENLHKKVRERLKIKENAIQNIMIHKKSIDARKKQQIYYVYEVDVILKQEKDYQLKKEENIFWVEEQQEKKLNRGSQPLESEIYIIGSGPAGLFAAYILSKYGYHPIILERGKDMQQRIEDVNTFWNTGMLKEESNVQFGLGGAGTFSDGKLNTQIKDKQNYKQQVLEIFIENGAPKEIEYLQNPHIGTDLLREVVINIKDKIIQMGGKFLFDTKLTDLEIKDQKLEKIEINHQEWKSCSHLILAIGHSARDTFQMLYDRGLEIQSKPFAIGIRIMHPQEVINENQYGKYKDFLPNASYKLTYTTKMKRGVYSFCMCPGGYVVNASSQKNHLAINGMSNHSRDSKVANSAIVVTITKNDFGPNPLDGVTYQQELEKKTYQLANGKIPVQRWIDFQNNQKTTHINQDILQTKGSVEYQNICGLFPEYIEQSLREAIPYFGTKIKGFDNPDTILAAIESRTSSPIRIIRNTDLETNILGIYPCGEGSGYAGGIVTSAIDGIKVAEKLITTYKM